MLPLSSLVYPDPIVRGDDRGGKKYLPSCEACVDDGADLQKKKGAKQTSFRRRRERGRRRVLREWRSLLSGPKSLDIDLGDMRLGTICFHLISRKGFCVLRLAMLRRLKTCNLGLSQDYETISYVCYCCLIILA